jgi:1-deoxy-D-xylulose-5-phosphate reductoisomerase
VVLKDGTLLAQLTANDMRIPILYALGYPKRLTPPVATLEPSRIGRLDFSAPDHDRFPTLGMARAALRAGGEMPVVLNAVNEVAVAVFLDGRCRFGHIADTICRVMDDWSDRARPMTSVDEILALDADARRRACEVLGNTDAPSLVRRS